MRIAARFEGEPGRRHAWPAGGQRYLCGSARSLAWRGCRMSLVDALPTDPGADSLYAAFSAWLAEQGLTLYPHQEEAVIELLSDNNVVLGTPTGSGKSLVAVAAHFAALAEGRTSYYTAPIKALVSEKFFALFATFGA